MADYDSARALDGSDTWIVVGFCVFILMALFTIFCVGQQHEWVVVHTGVLKQVGAEGVEFEDGFVLSKRTNIVNDYWEKGKTYNLMQIRSNANLYKLEEPSDD